MSNRIICVLLLVSSLCGLALLPQSAFAQQPKPPTLCVEGAPNCGTVPPISGTKIKWHPGHYVKTQGDHSDTDQDDYYNGIINGNSMDRMNEVPEMWGVFVAFAWGALEITEGVYDFTRMDQVLARIEADNGTFGQARHLNHKPCRRFSGLAVLRPSGASTRLPVYLRRVRCSRADRACV